MKPYDRLTILRNRFRARDVRNFRGRVRAYFEQFEYDAEGLPVDWEGVQATRAEINRMLPRIAQIVEAADLETEMLHNIFSSRYAQGAHQEILDVTDMAIGVYDASRFAALARTFNPFHYVLTALGFLAGLPRRALVAMGLFRPRSPRRPDDLARVESVLSRLAGIDELIETRFADMREWQSRLFAESADRVADLAERMDFLERVLAQQRPVQQLKPGEKKAATPV